MTRELSGNLESRHYLSDIDLRIEGAEINVSWGLFFLFGWVTAASTEYPITLCVVCASVFFFPCRERSYFILWGNTPCFKVRQVDVDGTVHTWLRPGDGALIHRDPLAHIVVGLQCDDIVGAGVCEIETQRAVSRSEEPDKWTRPSNQAKTLETLRS